MCVYEHVTFIGTYCDTSLFTCLVTSISREHSELSGALNVFFKLVSTTQKEALGSHLLLNSSNGVFD